MRVATRILAFVFVLFVFASGCSMIYVAGASAQEAPENPIGEDENSSYDELDEDIREQLGDLIIHDYSFEDGVFTIEASWAGRAPERITLTEMLELDSGGATQISFERLRLNPDERTEIKMSAEERSGGTAAILITTPQSVDNGNALVLQAGDPSSYPDLSFDLAVLSVGASAVLASAGTFIMVFRIKRKENKDKERIA